MKYYKEMYERAEGENRRNYQKFQLVYQWMKLSHAGIRLREFFVDYQIDSIAIYGLGELGRLFYDDMQEQGISGMVRYGIDKNKEISCQNLPVYTLDELPSTVDAIIISPVLISDEIEDEIFLKVGEWQTFTMEEILYELSRKHHIASALWKV